MDRLGVPCADCQGPFCNRNATCCVNCVNGFVSRLAPTCDVLLYNATGACNLNECRGSGSKIQNQYEQLGFSIV